MAGLRAKRSAAKRAPAQALNKIKSSPGTSVATLAGIAAAGAGAAAAVHYLRKTPKEVHTFRVVKHGDDGWAIMAEGSDTPKKVYPTKSEAVKAARRTATDSAPSALEIQGADGKLQATHSYE